MYIHPSDPDPARARGLTTPASPLPANAPATPRDAKPAPAADRTEFSDAARELAESVAARPLPAGLPAVRAREVLARIANGHYDRAEVLDRLAERLMQAWGRGPLAGA